jgi:hypothetical protein
MVALCFAVPLHFLAKLGTKLEDWQYEKVTKTFNDRMKNENQTHYS